MAREVARTERTQIYCDCPEQFDRRQFTELARTLDGSVRNLIEAQIGPVADVDGDGRLTILVTDLAADSVPAQGTEPVHGCVRARDFLSVETDFGGDIIYLARQALGEEMQAIAAHELAHAAVFSALLRSGSADTQIPCWLNEAIAHYAERLVSPDSKNSHRRMQSFLAAPHLYPVVVPDEVCDGHLRRGPARAAGFLFLEHTLTSFQVRPRHLLRMTEVGEAGISAATDQPFEELLCRWGASLADSVPHVSLQPDVNTSLKLRGTAFLWLAPATSAREVSLNASNECQLRARLICTPKSLLVRSR